MRKSDCFLGDFRLASEKRPLYDGILQPDRRAQSGTEACLISAQSAVQVSLSLLALNVLVHLFFENLEG